MTQTDFLAVDQIHHGDARRILEQIRPASVALSVWSPPYFVGKSYEKDMTFEQWQDLLATVIQLHYAILKPGAFLVVNIADILVFPDPAIPRIQAETLSSHRLPVTREEVLGVMKQYPGVNRYQIAKRFQWQTRFGAATHPPPKACARPTARDCQIARYRETPFPALPPPPEAGPP
jgi:hypothetical protein